MFLGPCGILEIDEGWVPDWVNFHFDSGTIDAEEVDEANVKGILSLIESGHARMLRNVAQFHTTPVVAQHVLKYEEENEVQECKKQKTCSKM